MARRPKYGPTLRESVTMALDWRWEQFWNCTIKRQHLVKMGSYGRCYRCGKVPG
jgi:hypothetical protein